MNSKLLNQNFKGFYDSMTKEDKNNFINAAVHYYNAMNTGDTKQVRELYIQLLNLVKSHEEASGICLIDSPDDQYLCALTSLSSGIYNSLQSATQERKTKTFSSTYSANLWLSKQNNLTDVAVSVQTKTELGLFAHHSGTREITVQYRKTASPNPYVYGIVEEEKTHLFCGGDLEKYKRNWKAENPSLELISIHQARNSRASSSSLFFGFGLDYVEHAKYYVTYRKMVSK